MKFLIWFLCLFVFTLLNEMLGAAVGFKLGYLILYLACAAVAKALCRKWDEHKEEEKQLEQQAQAAARAAAAASPTAIPTSAIPAPLKPPVEKPAPVEVPPVQPQIPVVPVTVTEADKKELKHRAVAYLPRNLEQTGAQRQILRMLEVCVPSVKPCAETAEKELWPRVEQHMLPMNHALARCAKEINTLISITIIENLKLEAQSRENLLKAWIALDYYAYQLKAEHSVHIRKLQDKIAGILKEKKA